MVRSPSLSRRSFIVFAAAALLAVGGETVAQLALRAQRQHYSAIGALAAQRVAASRLVRAVVLDVEGDGAERARARAEAAAAEATAAAQLEAGRATLLAPDDKVPSRGVTGRALRDAAGPQAAAIADAQARLLEAARRVAASPPGGLTRADVDTLLAAERRLVAVTNERSRVAFAAADADLAGMRRTGAALTALLLATILCGALLVVRPAARELERLVAELLTSRTQLEAATREATAGREFAASLVASAADAIYAFGPDLVVTEWNPAMAAWTGVPRAAALGQRCDALAPVIEWGPGGRPYARALAGETVALAELMGRPRPGAPARLFDVTCAPLRDSAGGVTGAVVTARDVTARVEATAQLRASEARFHALYQQSPFGIVMHDDEGMIRDANPAFERLSGRPVDELRRMRAADLSPAEDAEITRAPVRELYAGTRDVVQVEKRIVRATGEVLWANLTVCRIDALGGGATTVGMAQDITERKALEARLSHQAYHDPLTGLANRARLRERVEAAVSRAAATGAAPARVAVLYVDLDDFKKVNDSLGHAAGDRLLRRVADRLLGATRGCDTVARLGGDEFAVLLERVRDDAEARVVAERVGRALRAPFRIDGTEVVVGASVGIARLAESGPGAGLAEASDALLRDADVAMYAAKRAGKGRYALHEPGMHAAAQDRLALERDLRRAVERGELCVHFQPIVELATGRPVGAEALVRWRHPQRGLLHPAAFVPMAEESGLVSAMGAWVLAAACAEAAGWAGDGPDGPGSGAPTLTVNVSARQLLDAGFVDGVRGALSRSGLSPRRLLLELTESVLVDHDGPTLDTLRALKALGVRLGIDDFGTGYSSLRYLQRFPVDVLKVDKSFVAALGGGGAEPAGGAAGEPADGVALARAVLALGNTLSLRTVAEGVETEAQRAQLVALGCRFGQGYLFARPVPGEAVRAMFEPAAATA